MILPISGHNNCHYFLLNVIFFLLSIQSVCYVGGDVFLQRCKDRKLIVVYKIEIFTNTFFGS